MKITNISNIDSAQFINQDYTTKDESLLNSLNISKEFGLPEDKIELHVIAPNGDITNTVYDFKNYTTRKTYEGTSLFNQIELDPKSDLESFGLDQGQYDINYNFYRELFLSSIANKFYITEISSDRTEIKISTNNTSYTALGQSYLNFIAERNSRTFYSDFILNFGDNKTYIGVNVALDNTNTTLPSLYIKLYEPLPANIKLKDTFWIVESISEPFSFQVNSEFIAETTPDSTQLRGPNINIGLIEKTSLTTPYLNLSNLLSSNISSSYQQLQSWLEEKSIEITVDYNNFSNFVHFSSANERLENFKYKLTQIQNLQKDIYNINHLTSSVNTNFIKSSVFNLQSQVDNLIQKFDGYEYFLYYESGSNCWPKTNTTKPYINYNVTSSVSLNWFATQSSKAYNYDNDNRDYVWNNLPEYIREDTQNNNLELFVAMLGQHYDYIWTYVRDITDLQVADNRVNHGISKDLVADTLRNFGIKLYTNSRDQEDLYLSLLGINSDNSTLPSTGSLKINNYVTASQYTIPDNDIVKETYKRIYHNLPYLLKTKGTRRGLYSLINCFGIPETILKVKEYGGNKKDQNIIEQINEKFNYSLNLHNEAGLAIPFQPSYKQYLDKGYDDIFPDTLEFRFKLDSSNIAPTQSILESSNDYKTIKVVYTTGSYANINFGLTDTNSDIYSSPINLPLYNNDWWTLNLTRQTGSIRSSQTEYDQTYILTIGNKDSNGIQYLVSSSIYINGRTQTDFNKYGWSLFDYIFPGGNNANYPFSGLIQEFRYWVGSIPINDFKDHILNPQSIVYNGVTGSYNNLIFRLPLGSELDNTLKFNNSSVHPSAISSFIASSITSSIAQLYGYNTIASYDINHETFLVNTPNIGSITEIDEKVRIATPNLVPGNVLTPYISIQKPETYPITPDLNIVEVAISPQDSINEDIISQLGSFNIDEYVGDPRLDSSNTYPALTDLRNFYFKKYSKKENIFDLIKLLSYFDNSLFKMIKDFVPAKANLSTGLVIKPHILERNKISRHEPILEFVDYSGSIETAFITGSNGLNKVYNTAYTSSTTYISGSITKYNTQNKELFTGELGGTILRVHSQSQDNIVYELNHISTDTTQDLHDNFYRLFLNPTLNNVMGARISLNYLKADYSTNSILPVNYNYLTASLFSNLNNRSYAFLNAPIQDSNYTLYRHFTPRYNGSKLFNTQNNIYTTGDISYGNNPVINYNSVKFAYFKEITSQSLTLPGRVNANIKYLIDSASNVVELTEANKSLFDVQSIFNKVNANVALDNVNQPSKQKPLNGLKPIFAGGFRYYPIFQNVGTISSSLSFTLDSPLQLPAPTGSTGSINTLTSGQINANNFRLVSNPITGSNGGARYSTLDSSIVVDITKKNGGNQDQYLKVTGSVSYTVYFSGAGDEKPRLYINYDGSGSNFASPPGDNAEWVGAYGIGNNGTPIAGGPFWKGLQGVNGAGGAGYDMIGSIWLPAGVRANIYNDDNFGGNLDGTWDGGTNGKLIHGAQSGTGYSGQTDIANGISRTLSNRMYLNGFQNLTNVISLYGMDGVEFSLSNSSASLSTSNTSNPFNQNGITKTLQVFDTIDTNNNLIYTTSSFNTNNPPPQALTRRNGLGITITFEINGFVKLPSDMVNNETRILPILDSNFLIANLKSTITGTPYGSSGGISITDAPIVNSNIVRTNTFYYGAAPKFTYSYNINDNGFNSGSDGNLNWWFERGTDGNQFYFLTASLDLSIYYFNYISNPNKGVQNLFTQTLSSFNEYEDISLPFFPKRGDIIRLWDSDRGIFPIDAKFEKQILDIIPPISYPASSSYENRLVFKVGDQFIPDSEIQPQSCLNGSDTHIQNFIFLSKIEDETNVVLFTDKQPGQTSAGILLPEYLDSKTKENAGNIIKNLKAQNLI
jgi:hypothetical protein